MEKPTLEQKKEELEAMIKILASNLEEEMKIRRINNSLRVMIDIIKKDIAKDSKPSAAQHEAELKEVQK